MVRQHVHVSKHPTHLQHGCRLPSTEYEPLQMLSDSSQEMSTSGPTDCVQCQAFQLIKRSAAQDVYQQSLHHAHSRMVHVHVWEQACSCSQKIQTYATTGCMAQSTCQLPCKKTWATAPQQTYSCTWRVQWLPVHGGTVLPDGSLVASPTGVNVCLHGGFTL